LQRADCSFPSPVEAGWIETRVIGTSAEASCLAPFDGNPSNGAWLGAFTPPADNFSEP
jgi:hypothetical protein